MLQLGEKIDRPFLKHDIPVSINDLKNSINLEIPVWGIYPEAIIMDMNANLVFRMFTGILFLLRVTLLMFSTRKLFK